MKQSTKLLSLVLALIMAFSCMSVIGNAALDKTQVKYDVIDDADLTPEQVAEKTVTLLLFTKCQKHPLFFIYIFLLKSIGYICIITL